MKNIAHFLIIFLFITTSAFAQDSVQFNQIDFIPIKKHTESMGEKQASSEVSHQSITTAEAIRGVAVGVFSLALLGMVLWFAFKSKENKLDTSVSQFLTLFMLIIPTVILVTIGFSTEQISTVLGLFGTIAGYILGKQSSNGEEKCKKVENQPPQQVQENQNSNQSQLEQQEP